ncbi:hypothetical protein N431DRAFT_561074 [Stipitochalara longipes BDJ]|nr:hypothetical protein N431DRAFT_561074 [Stipitochalara longipes BDJ]
MSPSSSSPFSLSSDPDNYISILPNIKRKAINAGARPLAFDNHLHSVLLIINSALYNGYSEADKAWHIDLFMWEHYFTEPFPFLTDIDLHPNSNTSTTIISRNPCVPRPADNIFSSPPCVPSPGTPVRDPRNRFRGVVPDGSMNVPSMEMGNQLPMMVHPPPAMGKLSGQGEILEWQRGTIGRGVCGMNGVVHQGPGRENRPAQMHLAAVSHEAQPPRRE